MSRYFVIPQEGVGPGGTIVFRKSSGPYGQWNVFVGDVHLGDIWPAPGGLWDGISHGETPNEWFGEIDRMDGFGTRYAAAQFIIKHHGYWLRDERQCKADRKRWAEKLAQILKAKTPELDPT